MSRRIATVLIGAVLALAGLAAAPLTTVFPVPSGLGILGSAEVAVTKSLGGDGGGGGGIAGSGNRFAGLLSDAAVPVVITVAGILLIGTLAARNIGASVGIVVITLTGLIFLLSPQSIEATAKALANVVF